MSKQERINNALIKIQKIAEEVQDLFPDVKKVNLTKVVNEKSESSQVNAIKVLKRVSGIIANYDESNAERKLESLLKFLSNK